MSVIRRESRQKATNYYIADTLRAINEILATQYGGPYTTTRLAELLKDAVTDERTGDEIAEDIINRAGLKMKGSE